MHIQTDRALIPANTPTVRYLRVVISAPPPRAAAAAPRPPVDVALVLDRSGSMGGTKIAMARTAVDHAIRLLKPHDRLAIVCYDEEVDTVLERTLATREAKALALGRLAQIDARGSTDLCGGWLRGSEQVAQGAASGVKRVLLLTDGLANHGIVGHQELAAIAARLRAEGVTTSTFGIGADFDEDLLSRLATEGGGHFYFIEQAGQIPDFFTSELGEALEIVARDAVFEITCAPGVEAELVNNLAVEQVEGRLRVRLGDLVADQEVTIVVAVAVRHSQPLGSRVTAQCCVSDRDHVLFPEPMTMDWRVVDAAGNVAQPVDHAVVLTVAALLAERARTMALQANRRGAFDDAQGILRKMIGTLHALAPGDQAVGAVIARLQHDAADYGEAMSPIALKRRHFASYSVAESRGPEGKARRKRVAS